jgi:hypothetical protein
MKKSILSLNNVEELTTQTKKNICGGRGKVQVIADYCCLPEPGYFNNPRLGIVPSGDGVCPDRHIYTEGIACSGL